MASTTLPVQAADYVPFTPRNRTFACEIPEGWTPMTRQNARGWSTHIFGPAEDAGSWRAAYHIHYYEKGRPGFLPLREFLKTERRRDKYTDRDVTPMTAWRVAKKPAKLFQVREKRILPSHTLPSQLKALHHFYLVLPGSGEDYFVVKLTTTEETYLDYRKEFRRFLKSFRIVGY